MGKNLVIVESPAKAKTIEQYLGREYTVKSSFGHIRDLPKKGLNIDIEKDFRPTYTVSDEKKKVVSELKKAAAAADTVWLASDEDREGEAIAWHLCQALKLDAKKTKRIVFHEITRQAIERAIKNPRTVDEDLVNAQQARRVLDRLVGYELSPVLWKKVRTGLSAGRVQSVAVRLIVEREREIEQFKTESAYKLTATFRSGKEEFQAELAEKLPDAPQSRVLLEDAATAAFKVSGIAKKPGKRDPSPPFTTSSLQQEAARRLGFGVKQTMVLAQKLYEHGHITYMRTDSLTLSGQAIKAAEAYIDKEWGTKYHQSRQYKTKTQGAQEAHEAIRPTDFRRTAAGDDASAQKLYRLIWQRALASQMAGAQVERTEIRIAQSNRDDPWVAKGEVLVFDGFLKVYGGGKDDALLPAVAKGDELALVRMAATQVFTRPPARYSEAALVKRLEELGIGRPSTYAPTISTIQSRGYVEKRDLEGVPRETHRIALEGSKISETTAEEVAGADKNKLLPTHLALVTTDFLLKHFSSIVDYAFTARAEQTLDAIAEGKQDWVKMLDEFYKKFRPLIEKSEDVSRAETSQARVIGNDPASGKVILARYGRYGPMLQRGETESDEKPAFAPLPAGASLETVTLDQALEMFKLPRNVGTTADGQAITANIGRFGPYVQVGKTFVSIKPLDPMAITEEEARRLYAEKLDKESKKHVKEFPKGLKVMRGQYGPYITDGKKNVRIPKTMKPETITEEDALKLLAAAPQKRRGYRSPSRA